AVGGMTGRLVVAFLADYGSWRMAMAAIGIAGLVSCIVFWKALAPSKHFVPRALSPVALIRTLVAHMGNPGIALLVIEGFLLLGSFMVLFNYIGFRLQAAPFHLSQAMAGLVFIVYPLGSFGSATMGAWAGRQGRGKMLVTTIAIMIIGLVLMFPDSLLSMCIGLAIMTFGFFGAHSICSGWAPALAERDRAQSSSLYLLFYYTGGGVAGSLGGFFWDWHGWNGVIGFSAALMVGTLLLAVLMWRYARVQ
ncbi:MAG: MFS transporter, partial [Beijerinckiaceae bacterium]|nr:MFS transporter [Beijerinckiaceae bacterium]